MKTEETTETTPAAAGSTVTPELLTHVFNEHGVCDQPENVKIPMPKGFACVLHLALDAEGLWHFGLGCTAGTDVVGHLPSNAPTARAFTTRGDALGAAVAEAIAFFADRPKAKKAVAAVEFFAKTNSIEIPRAGSPANTPADGADTSAGAAPVKGEFAEIPVMKVQPNPRNHRKVFDEAAIAELAESIRREGLLQPIAVRQLEGAELPGFASEIPLCPEYEIILGERRWRAHVKLGAETIQAKVYRGIDSGRAQVLALIENLQRVQLNPIEEAEGYAELIGAGLTQEAIAQRVGRSRPVVANALRLLKLPEAVLDYIRQGELTAAHGVALARFADWPQHLQMMADIAVREQSTAGELEKGVPFCWQLQQQKIAVIIRQWEPTKLPDKLKKHPAYIAAGEGDYVCFAPPHWAAEVEQIRERAQKKIEAERLAKEEELAKQAKKGKKLLNLSELDSGAYRELAPDLLELVPEEKKAAAKGEAGRTGVATDVALADRLQAAMKRAIKADRAARLEELRAKVRKKIAALKKVSSREWSWLLYSIATYEGRDAQMNLASAAAKQVGVKLPKAWREISSEAEYGPEREEKRKETLAVMATIDPVDAVKVLMEERLEDLLTNLVEHGPECIDARVLRWWLDTDTLWLLEETEAGRGELIEKVKNAPWYQAALAGGTAGEEGGAE